MTNRARITIACTATILFLFAMTAAGLLTHRATPVVTQTGQVHAATFSPPATTQLPITDSND